MSKDTKIASTSSSNRSRKAIQKKVMSVLIKEVQKLKSDHISAPPSDSWAWRKYGQKPIKGSPYPRGYYRCSSSKGCPARKQVERSKVDSNMVVVTYCCEHNHPWPAASRTHHHRVAAGNGGATTSTVSEEELEKNEEEVEEEKKPTISNQSQELIAEERFTNFGEFEWLSGFESTNCTLLESPILEEDSISRDNDMGMIFTMREEDEPLFADLGELPECSAVFRPGMAEQRRRNLGTTGWD